jgi:anti-sigma factor RsiW
MPNSLMVNPPHLRSRQTNARRHHETITCAGATVWIGAYLAGDLSAGANRAFEAHLSGCPDCRAFLATYKRTIALTRRFLASSGFQSSRINLKLRLPSAR